MWYIIKSFGKMKICNEQVGCESDEDVSRARGMLSAISDERTVGGLLLYSIREP